MWGNAHPLCLYPPVPTAHQIIAGTTRAPARDGAGLFISASPSPRRCDLAVTGLFYHPARSHMAVQGQALRCRAVMLLLPHTPTKSTLQPRTASRGCRVQVELSRPRTARAVVHARSKVQPSPLHFPCALLYRPTRDGQAVRRPAPNAAASSSSLIAHAHCWRYPGAPTGRVGAGAGYFQAPP